jgi:23S rRNA (adenine2503-C2)-methyltransferase
VIVDKILRSSDGTSVKVTQITRREGFATIESGRYEIDGESIFCLSTQIGCAMSCGFCRSTEPFEFYPGKPQRILRSLSAQEIVDQALNAFDAIPVPQGSRGIVSSYMGIGEPFANIRAVKDSIIQLGTKYPKSRATLSTIGFDLAGIRRLADEVTACVYPIPVKLHVSLHSSSDEQRKRIIPRASPILETLNAAEYYAKTTGTAVKLNYVLVSGLNGRKEDANRLGALLEGRRGLIVKISDLNSDDENLIISPNGANQFEAWLKEFGIETCRFSSSGRDINAGCGELVKGRRSSIWA